MDNHHIELTDAVIRNAALPQGKKQHLLHDLKVTGLALRMRDSGGRSWVYLHRKPGDSGTKKHTIGAWPKITVENARKSATIIAADLIKRTDRADPTEDKAARQAAKQRKKMVTLAQLILNDPVADQPGPYEKSLLRRQVINHNISRRSSARNTRSRSTCRLRGPIPIRLCSCSTAAARTSTGTTIAIPSWTR